MTLEDRDRCWPCTVANLAVGLGVAWMPLVVVRVAGNPETAPVAAGWGLVVTAVTVHRLVGHGYLPLAERVGKATGLHERVGPGSRSAGGADDPEANRTEDSDDSTP